MCEAHSKNIGTHINKKIFIIADIKALIIDIDSQHKFSPLQTLLLQ